MLLLADALVALVCASGGLTEGMVDTSYGRLDGDSAIALSTGAAFDARGVRGVLDLRYRYLSSAGIFLTYEDGFGAGSEPLRLGLAGLELRPVFLARFLQGSELGRPRLDLLIDSIAIEVGGFVAQPANGNFGDGYGLSVAFALELPLLPHIGGPFIALRAGLRWSHEALSAAESSTVDVRAFVFTIAFGWQATFRTHVIDVGDVRQ
jgi:hypothetical protein